MEFERGAPDGGHLFAMGCVASTCCPDYDSRNPVACRDATQPRERPYETRPSMQAAGMDVFRTSRNAGPQPRLASPERFRWSGLVLID